MSRVKIIRINYIVPNIGKGVIERGCVDAVVTDGGSGKPRERALVRVDRKDFKVDRDWYT